MKNRSVIAVVTAASLLSLTLTGCENPLAKKEEVQEETEIILDVTTTKPVVQNITISSDFAASVEADNSVKVIPKVAGEVVEKNFEVGDHVNEGDLLFAIDDESYQIAMKQAQASLATAKAGYTAQQASTAYANISGVETIGKMPTTDQQMSNAVDSAYAQKVTAGNSYDSAGATVESLRISLDALKDDLEDAEDDKDDAKKLKDSLEGGTDEYAAADASYDAAKEKVESLERQIEQMELQIRQAENSGSSAEMNYYVAQEGYDMALRQKSDYDTYTKSTTLFGVNNSVVGAESALTTAQQSVKQAEAGVENAQMALDNTQVTAPVSGTITEINVSLHNMASQQTTAYVIESDAKNKIVFYVAEETAANIKPGNTAIVKKNGKEYSAKITNINDTLDSSTGLFKVEASADTDELISGSDVSIKTDTRRALNVLTVPINAVYYDEEQAYVLVNENNIAVRYDVTTGLSSGNNIEIKDGIDAEAQIITSYSNQLKDGSKIRVSDVSGNSAAEVEE